MKSLILALAIAVTSDTPTVGTNNPVLKPAIFDTTPTIFDATPTTYNTSVQVPDGMVSSFDTMPDWEALKGLVAVRKENGRKLYTYETASGHKFDMPFKLKVKDLRTYEEAHPKLDKFHKGCARWESSIGLGATGLGVFNLARGKKIL